MEELQERCQRLSSKLVELEGHVRPTLAAASAAISAGQAAERRAADALVQRGGFEQERNSLKQVSNDAFVPPLHTPATQGSRARC